MSSHSSRIAKRKVETDQHSLTSRNRFLTKLSQPIDGRCSGRNVLDLGGALEIGDAQPDAVTPGHGRAGRRPVDHNKAVERRHLFVFQVLANTLWTHRVICVGVHRVVMMPVIMIVTVVMTMIVMMVVVVVVTTSLVFG